MGMLSKNAAFEYLLSTLKDTIRTYDFFVIWEKVLGNVSQIEISLNILNSLIGKEDIASKLKELIQQYPEIVPVIPFLIAVRGTSIKVVDIGEDIEYSFSKKKAYADEQIDKIVFFAEKSGLLKVIADKSIKNLVDYAIGVEVGLDTNARKNRSSTAMENLTEVLYVKAICDKHGFKYLAQATVAKIKQEFGKIVATDKSDRHFAFAIDTGNKVYLMEVNYYGGRSKLKSVAGEFNSLFSLVKNETTGFIWVTDDEGCQIAKHPLSETFNATYYVMNINMIEQGLLEEIVTKGL